MTRRIIRGLSLALWVLMWALIVAGALVTSTGSGMAVPDWPTTFGQGMFDYAWFSANRGVFIEHGHRVIGTVVGLVALALVALLFYAQRRRSVRVLSGLVFLAVAVQGILGGKRVLLDSQALAIVHGCFAQFCFAALSVLVVMLSEGWTPYATRPGRSGKVRVAVACLTGTVILQLILGAILRHTGMGLALHVAVALAVVFLTAWLVRVVFRSSEEERAGSGRPVAQLAALVAAQALLGGLAWVSKDRVPLAGFLAAPGFQILLTTAHVAVGSLILARVAILSARWFDFEGWGARALAVLQAYLELARVRIALMAAVAAAVGSLLASSPRTEAAALGVVTLGVFLASAGAGTLNQYMERDTDARMRRTAGRPLPSGRLSPRQALVFGTLLSASGVVWLSAFAHPPGAALCALGLALYLFGYTPLKSRSAFNTWVGAVPGAMPPLIGWAASGRDLDLAAWILFGIVFLWQLPHFMAIAWVHREDYARAGLKMISLTDGEGEATSRQAVGYCLALLPMSLAPTLFGMSGPVYFYGALFLGLAFLVCAIWFSARRTDEVALQLERTSIVYLPALFCLLVQDAAFAAGRWGA